MLKQIPFWLVGLRVALGPLLLLNALDGQTDAWFLAGFITGFLSDIFDGVIARRMGTSTAQLRQADSWADVCFYGCIFAATWLVHQETVLAFQVPLLTVVAAQLVLYGLNWIKFGKTPSYHTYTAKAWGIGLCAAVVALFGFGQAGIYLWLAIALALLNSLEEIIMTALLQEWQYDVPSLLHILRSRPPSELSQLS